MTRQHKIIFLFTSLLLTFSLLSAEIIDDNDFGFSLDIPEGFKIADSSDDGMSYQLEHPNIGVTLILKINEAESGCTSEEVLNANMTKLKAECEVENFMWNKSSVSISSFNFKLDTSYSGWAVCVPTKVENYYLNLLCYAPSTNFAGCQQFIISTLNSLCNDDFYYNAPGIITTFAYQRKNEKKITLNIGGKKINTAIDEVDEEAAQFVVDLEYSVLTLYANHPDWKEAWKRYYRMIYRDSFGRLEKVCSDVYDVLYPVAQKKNPENPDIAYAQLLLSWVQEFNYKRADDPKKSDFTCLPSVLTGTGNDCDSRSMLICTLLKSTGTECLLLISPEYAHAMAAADIQAPGQQYTLEETGSNYIMGETTAKVTWGTIAQDHSDRTKWFPVILP